MNKKFNIDIKKMCEVEGLLHVYVTNEENIILAANQRQLCVAREILGVTSKDIIGTAIHELLGKEGNAADVICRENEEVMRSGLPKQFYNKWLARGIYRIDMVTIKTPIYDNNGKIAGVFGISHYVNKFSISKALSLGLSRREAECLFYLLQGKSDGKIAEVLRISHKTVEGYIDNVKNKLGCFNRSELIFKVTQLKLKESIDDELDRCNGDLLISHSFHELNRNNKKYRDVFVENH